MNPGRFDISQGWDSLCLGVSAIFPAMKDKEQTLMQDLLTEGNSRRGQNRQRRPRPCGRARAAWWFDEMRRVVDQGRDYPVTGVR